MMRSRSVLASTFAWSIVSALNFSPVATISPAFARASSIMSATRFSAFTSVWRPSSPACRPSAICRWRVSIWVIIHGQIARWQNQMNRPKPMACMISVRLMFMTAVLSGQAGRDERIAECEQHRDAEADDERRVDQAQQQKDLRLQLWHQFRLARRAFEKARAHDADADACAQSAQSDHQADTDAGVALKNGERLQFVHEIFLSFRGFYTGEALIEFRHERSVMLVRHREIHDGQHHEDVCLEQDDQQLEDGPAEMQERAGNHADPAGRTEHRDDQEHDLAGVHVSEQTQRMRQRLRYVFDEVEEQVQDPENRVRAERRTEELVDPATQTLDPDRVENRQGEHRQRERERSVHV